MQIAAEPIRDAALELLETLKLAVARVKLANDEGDSILSAWLPGALATIAKAEGRSASLNPPPPSGRERVLDALQRAERFMSGFEDDPLQEGIGDDLGAIRSAIADLQDGAATSRERGPDHE
ncbi:hypothetical protein [Shinella sp.]|uniref:hypothetical protein n=1 Tax=Shinella sp. TaxID=1870904 RepID=UPI003D2D39CF